jgi:ribonuclease HI
MNYYAVHKGHKPGIYNTWPDCEKQIKNFVGAQFKKFSVKAEAQDFFEHGFGANKPAFMKKKESSDKKNNDKIEKECIEDESEKIYIYTDGSFMKGHKTVPDIAGYGIHIPIKNISLGLPLLNQKITNNRAELTAIIDSFKYLDENDLKKKICIFTDSQYSIYIMTGTGERYEKSGFKQNGKPVPNIDLIKKALELIRKYNIVMLKVRAHTNLKDIHSINNDIVDKLAEQGAQKSILKDKTFNDIVFIDNSKVEDDTFAFDSEEDEERINNKKNPIKQFFKVKNEGDNFKLKNKGANSKIILKENPKKKSNIKNQDYDDEYFDIEEEINIFKNQCKKAYDNNSNNQINPKIQMNQLFEMGELSNPNYEKDNKKPMKELKLSNWFVKK